MVTIPLAVSFHSRSFAPRLPNAASSWEALNYIESGYRATQSFWASARATSKHASPSHRATHWRRGSTQQKGPTEGVHRCGVKTAAAQSGQGLGFLATTLAAKISEERIEHVCLKLWTSVGCDSVAVRWERAGPRYRAAPVEMLFTIAVQIRILMILRNHCLFPDVIR